MNKLAWLTAINNAENELRLRRLLSLLVVVLTFEGIARKALPAFSVSLFLFKDAIVTIMAFFVVQMPEAPALVALWRAYKILAVLFVPLIIATGWNDWWLAVFGAKQYLLFPMVGFATFYAFQNTRVEQIVRFFRWTSIAFASRSLVEHVRVWRFSPGVQRRRRVACLIDLLVCGAIQRFSQCPAFHPYACPA
jgi:hypothetical protein